jgi:hypothetical protein
MRGGRRGLQLFSELPVAGEKVSEREQLRPIERYDEVAVLSQARPARGCGSELGKIGTMARSAGVIQAVSLCVS